MGKGQNDLLFDTPSFYSQPISVSISFQIIPLPSLLGRGWGVGLFPYSLSIIPLPSLLGRGRGWALWGFLGLFFIYFLPKSAGTSPHLRVSHFTR